MPGLFSKPKAPKAPDTQKLVEQQGIENRNTARLNQRMNMVNSTGPFGSVTYTPGKDDRWSQSVRFDPVIQSLVDRSVAGSNISTGGLPAWQTLGTGGLPALNVPGVESTASVEDALYRRGMSRLAPELDRTRNRTDSTLAARGITSGSAASTKAYDDLARREADAVAGVRDSAILGAGQEQSRLFGISAARADAMARNRAQQFGENSTIAGFNNGVRGGQLGERLTLAQFPLQQAGGLIGLGNALKTGSQPAQVGVAGTDILGANQNAYANQLARYNTQAAGSNNMMSGLFGLGSAAIGGGVFDGLGGAIAGLFG